VTRALSKRLAIAEAEVSYRRCRRIRAEARAVPAERIEQIHRDVENGHRSGRSVSKYLQSLTNGELVLLRDSHDAWTDMESQKITREHLDQLRDSDTPMDRFTTAELKALAALDGDMPQKNRKGEIAHGKKRDDKR
jgi:hypothetical protein